MNSSSLHHRWPWTNQSGGASPSEQQRARLGAVGQYLARLTAIALGVWLMWAPPSSAFHDSALDPLSKQALARFLEEFDDECRAGNRKACVQARQVLALGDQLTQAQQACARGDRQACQFVAQVQQKLVALLREQADAPEMESLSPMPPAPTASPTRPRADARMEPIAPRSTTQSTTPESQNSLPNIDWFPLKTYFEISKVEIGTQEHVTRQGKVLYPSRITFIAEAKRSFQSSVVTPKRVRLYDADNIQVASAILFCEPRGIRTIQPGDRLRCFFGFDPSRHPTVEKITFDLSRGSQSSRSSGSNEFGQVGRLPSGGGLGNGDDCSRCEVYRTRESLCGRDCSVMNAYRPGASDAVDRCYDRAAECRAAAARAFEQCESQCRR